MSSTVESPVRERPFGASPPSQDLFQPYIIPLSILLNLVIAVACISLAASILSLPTRFDAQVLQDVFGWVAGITGVAIGDFGRLGRVPQDFVGVITLIPAIAALYGSWQLMLQKPAGRYITLTIQFVGAVLALVAVLHLWGVFLSLESIIDGVMENQFLILGFPLAYGVFWISGKFAEDSPWRRIFETATFVIGLFTVVTFVLFSDVLGKTNVINVTGDVGAWVATLMAIILGALGWRLLHLGDRYDENPEQRVAWQGWLMLSPNIIGFVFFFAGPLLLSLYLSFTDSTVGQIPNGIGLDNYGEILALQIQKVESGDQNPQDALSFGYAVLDTVSIFGNEYVLGAKDTLFWISLRNTIVFCLMLVPLSTIPALGLSLILNSKLPGVKFFRALYFLPSVAAVVGTALIWRWLYDPTIGYFNYVIREIVDFMNGTFGMGLADPNIQWLTGPGVVLVSIVFLAAWQMVGFNTVLFLAGLQNIPKTLYEAAMIDGANRWQQFRNVTLPMLRPATFFVITTTVITGLQVFNEPYALFPRRPIPEQATTSVYYIYNQGFFRFNFGYASAVAWLLFLFIFSITFFQFRFQRGGAYDD